MFPLTLFAWHRVGACTRVHRSWLEYLEHGMELAVKAQTDIIGVDNRQYHVT